MAIFACLLPSWANSWCCGPVTSVSRPMKRMCCLSHDCFQGDVSLAYSYSMTRENCAQGKSSARRAADSTRQLCLSTLQHQSTRQLCLSTLQHQTVVSLNTTTPDSCVSQHYNTRQLCLSTLQHQTVVSLNTTTPDSCVSQHYNTRQLCLSTLQHQTVVSLNTTTPDSCVSQHYNSNTSLCSTHNHLRLLCIFILFLIFFLKVLRYVITY